MNWVTPWGPGGRRTPCTAEVHVPNTQCQLNAYCFTTTTTPLPQKQKKEHLSLAPTLPYPPSNTKRAFLALDASAPNSREARHRAPTAATPAKPSTALESPASGGGDRSGDEVGWVWVSWDGAFCAKWKDSVT